MTEYRDFTDSEYAAAVAIGRVHAFNEPLREDDDRCSYRDRVHDVAFSEALDCFDEIAAIDISDAVDEGIDEVYTVHVEDRLDELG